MTQEVTPEDWINAQLQVEPRGELAANISLKKVQKFIISFQEPTPR